MQAPLPELSGSKWAPITLCCHLMARTSHCIGFHSTALDVFWRRQWQPTPVLLPGKSHGWRRLVGCSPWDREESDTTERLHFHFSLSFTGEGNGNPLQRSCLENPRDGRAWWAAVYGVAQSQTQLTWLSSSSSSRCFQSPLTPTQENYNICQGIPFSKFWLLGILANGKWYIFKIHVLKQSFQHLVHFSPFSSNPWSWAIVWN